MTSAPRSGTEMLSHLYRPGIFDRHRQRARCSRCCASSQAAERARARRSTASIRPAISASTCPIRSGSTGRPEHAALHPLAHRRDGADAADHLGAGLHHHRAAAGRLFRKLYRRAAGRRAKASTWSRSRRCAQEYGFDQPPVHALFLLGRRHAAGRFRLFLRVPAAGQRRRRRPDVADHAGVVRHHHLHLADRLPDRHLFGHAPVQLGRLRPDVPRPARPRHPEFHAGADPDVFRQCLVRHLDRPSDGPEISRRADELGQGQVDPRASVDSGDHHRHGGHGRHDPAAARQSARRAAEAICR